MNKRILIIGGTSEARELGTYLDKKGVLFMFSLTSKPTREYPFAYRVGKILDVISEQVGFTVKFEDSDESFDLIIDLTHPHAGIIRKILDSIDSSTELKNYLWRYQRQRCLKKGLTADSYEALTKWIVEKKAGKILSFMGCKGSEKIAGLLDTVHYRCLIYMRSIKTSHFYSEYVRLIPMTFSPSEMNNRELLRITLDEIEPELVLLKDSGTEGGTDVKRDVLLEKRFEFLGLRMPEKKTGKVFGNFERLKAEFP